MEGKVLTLDGTRFEAISRWCGLTVLDLWSPTCGPCHTLLPILEDLAGDFAADVAFFKVDVEDDPALRERLGVRSLPTLILYRDGSEIDRIRGMHTRSNLTMWIEAHL